MSLINDALKRAKQARPRTPSPDLPNIPLRPIEQPAQEARHGLGVLLPISLAVVALLGLLLVWEFSKRDNSSTQPKEPIQVSARALPTDSTSVTESAPANASASPVPAKAASANPLVGASETKNSGPPVSSQTSEPGAKAIASTEPLSVSTDAVDTNHASATEPSVPLPPPLRLQGIVYNPRRPSALINGRIVFVGDRVRDLHVIAIRSNEVVLAGNNRTNLLSLEP